MKSNFLFELWVEDLPPTIQKFAGEKLKTAFVKFFENNEITYASSEHFSTPRRIAVFFKDIPRVIPKKVMKIRGPSEKNAFKEGGLPTQALLGFLKKHNADLKDVRVEEVKGNRYVFVEIVKKAKKFEEVFKQYLPQILKNIKFNESMRWDGNCFPRPVRNILCIFGKKFLKVSCFGLQPKKTTLTSTGDKIKIENASGYEKTLLRNKIIPVPEKRKERILSEFDIEEKKKKVKIERDNFLLEYTVYSTEYPQVFLKEFDEKFLEIPSEILVETLKNHQKCFPVYNRNGLAPFFAVVVDGDFKNINEILENYKNCVEARFEDAKFFWEEDVSKLLEEHLKNMEKIFCFGIFKNLKNKTERVLEDCRFLSQIYMPMRKQQIMDVAKYIDFDIATKIVYEFPNLHGIAGFYILKKHGFNKIADDVRGAVCLDRITEVSALAGIVHRLNTIKSFFNEKIRPTTSKDPYGLKKICDEIVFLFINAPIYFEFEKFLNRIFDDVREDVKKDVYLFVKERFKIFLEKEGIPCDIVEMVVASFKIPKKTFELAKSIFEFKKEKGEIFETITQVFKRVLNILKQAGDFEICALNRDELKSEFERNLFEKLEEISREVKKNFEAGDYKKALSLISKISLPLNDFFDNVFVMDKNERIKNLRLSLLFEVKKLFSLFGEFDKLKKVI